MLLPVIQLYSKKTYVVFSSSCLVRYSASSLLETLCCDLAWELDEADLSLEMRLELSLTYELGLMEVEDGFYIR